MPKPWRVFPLFLLAASAFASGQSFVNTAIVRTIELGGSVAHITTTYAIKSQEDGLTTYTVALGRDDKEKTSWLEAKVKGQKAALQVKEHAFDDDRCVDHNSSQLPASIDPSSSEYYLVDIVLPQPLSINNTLNLVLETVQTHASQPWPAAAGQNEDQTLKYSTDLFVVSPYATSVQRTKIKYELYSP